MATARRDDNLLEFESDEEPNPFLSPPPPDLNSAVSAPPVPRRVNGNSSPRSDSNRGGGGGGGGSSSNSNSSSNRAAPGATAPGATSSSSSSSSRVTGRSRPQGSGGNPIAPPQQQQQGRRPSSTQPLSPVPVPPAAASAAAHQSSSRSPVVARPPRTPPTTCTTTTTTTSTTDTSASSSNVATTTSSNRSRRGGSGGNDSGSGETGSSSGSGGGAPAVVARPAPAPAAPAPASAALAASPTTPNTAAATAGNSGASNVTESPGNRKGSWSWGNIGRSLIGAVLGPGAVGGDESAAVEGRPRAWARELTPHVMQQTADGKYSVSVWRKNKQDSEPVQVSVGVYDSAYEGQRAAEAFSPVKWQELSKDSRCAICESTFGFVLKRRHHCRNCGRLVCSSCAEAFWPRNMLPPTYNVDTTERKVRVCSTCYKANEQFRKALLSGSEEEAMAAYSTGCVNLRVPYTIYHNELPVHCAAAGGNLNILAWLVEDRCCPLFLDRAKKVALGDSRKLSVMGAAAMSGNIQIMRYLAFTQGCKVSEIRDMNSLWSALEKCLYEGADVVPSESNRLRQRRDTDGSPSLSGGGSGGGGGGAYPGAAGGAGGAAYPGAAEGAEAAAASGAEVAAAVDDDDKSCIVCFDRKVNCTLVPCGHHCCCFTCSAQFEQCPVCRADVQQKIRTISI